MGNTAEPNWLKVIRYWGQQPGKTGPTLPFIFGATRTPVGCPPGSDEIAWNALDDLLMTMRQYKHSNGEYCAVRMCSVISEPVFTIERVDCWDTSIWGSGEDADDALTIYLGSMSQQEAASELLSRSLRAINQGHYSKREGRFQIFDAADLALINKALASG